MEGEVIIALIITTGSRWSSFKISLTPDGMAEQQSEPYAGALNELVPSVIQQEAYLEGIGGELQVMFDSHKHLSGAKGSVP
jgi:hypothetical protein